MKQMLHTKALVVRESVGATQAGVIDQVIGSTPVLDRMGDTITQEGWDLKNYKQNPVILWGHNMDEERPPIGKALKTWIDGKGKTAKLMFTIQFDLADEFAADIYRKIKEGFINTVSVGFLPTEWEELEPGNFWGGLRYTAQQLLELSFVPVPANPEALVGMRTFAKSDKRFTPIEENKLFAPIKNEKEIEEIFHVKVDGEGKAEQIDADPNSVPDEEGNISGGNGGGGSNDHIENKPDGSEGASYDTSSNIGEITAKDMRSEMCAAMEKCMPGATGTAGKKDNQDAEPTDPYHDLPGEGTEASMPTDSMKMKDMTVAHVRGLMQDVFGDWQSNLNTTSNQDDTQDGTNNYAFTEGEEKAETLRKAKGLVLVIEKAGRVLSGKNENLIKDAITSLQQVIADLEKEEQEEEGQQGKSLNDEIEEAKGAISYSDHGKAPESESWDGPGEVAKATPEDLKIMCAWYDAENADVKSSYKLPHHKADGDHVAVWRGVAAAMASLMGSRGGADIPEGDRKGVYNHLAKHYKEFEKDAPDFKMIEDQVLRNLDEEIHALILEREEKHVVRLIKKILENQKEDKKSKDSTTTADLEIKALQLIDLALTKVGSKTKEEVNK